MKLTHLLPAILFFILYSCQKNNYKKLEKELLGEWIYIKTDDLRKPQTNNNSNIPPPPPPPPFGSPKRGYIFLENNIAENKSGYFKRIDAIERENRKTFFLGTRTKYKIENDSIKIFNLGSKTWENQKLSSITGDTLTTEIGDSIFAKYARAQYKINPTENYDQIIVSSSGCYGSCPISNISIEKNGNILYYGQDYNTQNGFFQSKITQTQYEEIQTSFKKADIINLKDSYEANWTDDETVTITFIKNNKIIKTIRDYGIQSPTALVWAYTPVRYLYQHIKLTPLKKEKLLFPIWRISFRKGNQICDLTKSESYYLFTEILKGKETNDTFEHQYYIEFWNDRDKKEIIYTDGRYFKSKDKTIDIEYNFLISNNFIEKFRPKDKYD